MFGYDLPMHDWLLPAIPWGEKILRALLVYLFILLAFRLLGKRQVGQMTKYDLILLLLISNVVQNAMIGQDDSLLGGMVGAVTILVANFAVSWLSSRSKRFEHLMEGVPAPLVFNGKPILKNLHHEQMSVDDLLAALRRQGIFHLSEVKLAVIEDNGAISVLRYADHPAVGTGENP